MHFTKKNSFEKRIELKNNLKKQKILRKSFTRFKILGGGNITVKLDLEVDFASKVAKEKIEKVGGKLILKNTK